ncbi:MAG: glycosyltransferase family 2 protein [Faecalibacterium prausnitzii]|nr:glycosyltransferase family 2 protein [Faecalibacterium prausnitzii]
MKVYFVVLHFLNIEETLHCVESIKEIEYENKEIIIVDNGSNNDTGEKLQLEYEKSSNIRVIISKNNLGFSNGNNIGIYKITDRSRSLVVVCNSDLIFKDKNFAKIIVKKYEEYHYAVLGPDVTSEDMLKHENPLALEICTDKSIKREICIFSTLALLNRAKLVNIARALYKIYIVFHKKYDYRKELDNSIQKIKVHGSCFVLSPKYFDVYSGLYTGTFLFEEENILANMCLNSNLKILYTPDTNVVHLGSKSFKTKYPDAKRRFANYIDNCLLSLKSYDKSRRNKEI